MDLEKMKTGSKKAFTLIELLVVITIIGILATGAVATYTSQIQKARDTTRISDITALKSWIEQVYQDKWAYPNTWLVTAWLPSFMDVKTYVPKINADPKTWQKSWNSNFDYTYAVAADTNAIVWQIYEVSTHLENSWNLTEKAWKDWWEDWYRLEQWISITTLWTAINNSSNAASWINTATIAGTSCIAKLLQTATPPTAWVASAAPAACGTTESTNTANIQTLVIR